MSKETLEIAVSPCPNDTYLVGPLALGWVKLPFEVSFRFEDIETLNRLALKEEIPIIKVSFALLPEISDRYLVLPVGAALGRGVGPLMVALKPYPLEAIPSLRVLLPGEHTTAHLLFRLAFPQAQHKVFVPYHEILTRLASGEAELGVIIHESRFVFKNYGFHEILDLGAWWEGETDLPLPLGGFLARRDLPKILIKEMVRALRESLRLAEAHFEDLLPFISEKAQELSREVIERHIRTYVTEFSRDLGEEGRKALKTLSQKADLKSEILLWEGT